MQENVDVEPEVELPVELPVEIPVELREIMVLLNY